VEKLKDGLIDSWTKNFKVACGHKAFSCCPGPFGRPTVSKEYWKMRGEVDLCCSFLEAHEKARAAWKKEFPGDSDLFMVAEQTVLKESEEECGEAQKLIDGFDIADVGAIKSHRFCIILLLTAVHSVETRCRKSLLKEKEAGEMLAAIQKDIMEVKNCWDKHGVEDTKSGMEDMKSGAEDITSGGEDKTSTAEEHGGEDKKSMAGLTRSIVDV